MKEGKGRGRKEKIYLYFINFSLPIHARIQKKKKKKKQYSAGMSLGHDDHTARRGRMRQLCKLSQVSMAAMTEV